jgi:glutamine amidotransferase
LILSHRSCLSLLIKVFMKVAIVKYNAGNVESVRNALRRLNVEPVLTDDAETLRAADRVIFPGVGEASTAMRFLSEKKLDAAIKSLAQPVLGICLGMQLLCRVSDENRASCLGILPYRVRRFESRALKIPQMGWNNIFDLKSDLFEGVAENSYVYFVHSFYVETGAETIAACDYGVGFSAAARYKNFYAVQFHPEKSGAVGAAILENFLKI